MYLTGVKHRIKGLKMQSQNAKAMKTWENGRSEELGVHLL